MDHNGLQYTLVIEGRGGRTRFEFDRSVISNLAVAVSEIGREPDCGNEFVISRELSLRYEVPKVLLLNCAARYEFLDPTHLAHFWEWLQARELIARLFS